MVADRTVEHAEQTVRRHHADYDMVDQPEYVREWWASLEGVLGLANDLFQKAWFDADRAALRHQKYLKVATILSAVFATIAVLVAIAWLSEFTRASWVETLAAGVAGIAVLLAVLLSQQASWFLARHRAERCRLLKFRFLGQAALWCGSNEETEKLKGEYSKELRQIQAMKPENLKRWMKEDTLHAEPPLPSGCTIDTPMLRELVDYYTDKRLDEQMNYMKGRAEKNEKLDRRTRHLSPYCFFISILAAFLHFGIDMTDYAEKLHAFSLLFVVMAVAFPVLGAGIRTIRSAYEFARNTSRYNAKVLVLGQLRDNLARAEGAEAVLRFLWDGEQIMESEHREWLRLMVEAEWFG